MLGAPASERRDALRDELRDLPPETQEAVYARMADALVTLDDSDDIRPLKALAESILTTVRLHRNPAYGKALGEADAAATEPAAGMSAAEFVKRARKLRV